MIENTIPILRCDDLETSKRYYVEKLGFSIEFDVPYMAQVSRDGCRIMLAERSQGARGTWVWVGVEDAGLLHAELAAAGALIRDGLQNFEWSYEFQVEDPDGHVLRFGSESRSDLPHGRFKA